VEALFILLADLIILPMTLFAGVLVEGIVTAAAAVASFLEATSGIIFFGASDQKVEPSTAEWKTSERKLRRRTWLQRFSWGLGGMLILLVTAVCLLNFAFFESTVHWGLARIEKRSGVKIEFTSASGNLFSGKLTLKGATARRQGNTASNFDLRADEFTVNLSVGKLFAGTARIETVFLSGLKGDFQRMSNPEQMRLRRQYEISHLRIENAEISVNDTSGQKSHHFDLKIKELDSRPLRSRFAVFDLLFRSNLAGEIAGCPFTVQMEKTDHGRKTEWQAEELPVSLVAYYVGGPLNWLSGGTVDVSVADEWAIERGTAIDLHWRFILKNLEIGSASGKSLSARFLSSTVTEYLRQHAKQLEISFSLRLNEAQFEGTTSLGAAGLWDATRTGLAKQLAQLSGTDPEKWDQGIQKGIDVIKQKLDQSRNRVP
jgi:hypothetical protein